MSSADATTPSTMPWSDRPDSVYRLRPALRWLQGIAILVGSVGTAVPFSVGLWRWYLAYTQYGPAVVWRWSAPWLAVGVGLSPALILGVLSLLRTRGTTLAIYPSGIVYRRAGRLHQLPWPEIQALTVSGPWTGLPLLASSGQPVALTIQASEERRVRLTRDLERFDVLVNEVKSRVYPRLQRAYASAFNRGQTLRFGSLHIDNEGIEVGRRRLAWQSVADAQLRDGLLHISARSGAEQPGFHLAAAGIPNVDLCLQLIQGVLEGT